MSKAGIRAHCVLSNLHTFLGFPELSPGFKAVREFKRCRPLDRFATAPRAWELCLEGRERASASEEGREGGEFLYLQGTAGRSRAFFSCARA